MLATVFASMTGVAALSASLHTAIVTTDQAMLRGAARDSAQQQAVLRQGEMLEVRGERLDFLQVWDHQRERGGYVRASQVRRLSLAASEAPELLSVLRFVKDTPGQEALGIGLAVAWLKAAPASMVQADAGVEALDSLGTMADRLAARVSGGAAANSAAEATLNAHLDVARHYGLRFHSFERLGRVQVCYDGEAFRRVLAMAATPERQVRAALALTRLECLDPALRHSERAAVDEWRSQILDTVSTAGVPAYLQNRVEMRRASLWSSLAFYYTQSRGQPLAPVAPVAVSGTTELARKATHSASQALRAMANINKTELTDDDQAPYNDAAMRVNASRWAAGQTTPAVTAANGLRIQTVPGQPGETCVLLLDATHDASTPLLRRCTYGQVWPQSATANREGKALALAVQPLAAWRELWLFRKTGSDWDLSVLPPASTAPETGYAEFAGWVPGGKQILVAREARSEGKYTRNFAVLSLDTLSAERQSNDPVAIAAFQRWPDPSWRQWSLSLR